MWFDIVAYLHRMKPNRLHIYNVLDDYNMFREILFIGEN